MDTNLAYLIIIGIFAFIIFLVLLLFRQRMKVNLKGLLGPGLDVEASNQAALPTPVIKAEDLKTRKGGLKANDETSRGVNVKQVNIDKDIDLKSTSAPKAPPPA